MRRLLELDTGLNKLQDLLLGMSAGDELSVPHAADTCGLAAVQCEAVLEALTRAGLMTRRPEGPYIRRHLVEPGAAAPAVGDSRAPRT